MKIPIRIENDRIKDAIVQIFYDSNLSYEILVGYIHKSLTLNGFKYVPPVREHDINQQQIVFSPNHLFVGPNNKVKIQIHSNHSLTFNTISSYIGWKVYSQIILEVVGLLLKEGHINSFRRVGVRYISEFENTDILDKVKFQYQNTFLDTTIDTSTSNLKWREDGHVISLNLASNLPVNIIKESKEQISSISLIDIDVINQGFEIKEVDTLMGVIDACHVKQKKVFFSLLTEEFLQELKPEY